MATQIPLTQGYTALVDDQDKDLAELNWYAHVRRGGQSVYAVRNSPKINGKGTMIYLHRVILERKLDCQIPPGMQTDHISRDSLDNRRANLRLATYGQNASNSKRITEIEGCKVKTPYRGVYQQPSGRWAVQITVDNERLCLGVFDTPEQAATAWNRAALLHRGEFAALNNIKDPSSPHHKEAGYV